MTPRLRLRPPHPADAKSLYSCTQDPAVSKFLTWRPHASEAETNNFLKWCAFQWESQRSFPCIIELKERPGASIGIFHLRPSPSRVEFAFMLARSYWNNGYMTEAVSHMGGYCLNQHDVWRIWSVCDFENKASERVMQKSGMQLEGRLRRFALHPNISPVPRDCLLYARVREINAVEC